MLELGGGTFATPALSIASLESALVFGFGTIAAPVTNAGLIVARPGLLRITGAVTGGGAADIDRDSTLEFDDSVGSGQTLYFFQNATLALAAPSSFDAVISGFAAGDEIDLLGTTATSVSYQSNILTVLNGTTTVASLNLSGSYSDSTDFELCPDGNGGSAITIASVWTATGGGDWGTAANWDQLFVPGGKTQSATISLAGAYTATIAENESFTIGNLTVNDPSATLNVAGTLNLANVLNLDAGTGSCRIRRQRHDRRRHDPHQRRKPDRCRRPQLYRGLWDRRHARRSDAPGYA